MQFSSNKRFVTQSLAKSAVHYGSKFFVIGSSSF